MASSFCASSSSSSWQSLGGEWYRNIHLYSMPQQWTKNTDRFKRMTVACCPNGGPIACVRSYNHHHHQASSIADSAAPHMMIYTSGGSEICSFPWPYGGLVELDWIAGRELLVAVFTSGAVRIFTSRGEQQQAFTVEQRLKKEGGVAAAIVVPNKTSTSADICFLTRALRVHVNRGLRRGELVAYGGVDAKRPGLLPELSSSPLAFSAFRDEGEDAEVVVLVSTQQGQLLEVHPNFYKKLKEEAGELGLITHIAISHHHGLIAMLSQNGDLEVFVSTDLSTAVDTAHLDASKKTKHMVWCGGDCLALHVATPTPSGGSQHLLFLGGPKSDWLVFAHEGRFLLAHDWDGVRVMTPFKVERYEKVDEAVVATLGLGSCAPSAMLTFACQKYSAQDGVAFEDLRMIGRDEMHGAIEACTETAIREWDVASIRLTLRAAALGRLLLDPPLPRRKLMEPCRDIRVVLALRSSPVEWPITIQQLKAMGHSACIRAVAQRGHYLLAVRLCEYLGLSSRSVLQLWAGEKIRRNEDLTDRELETLLFQQSKGCLDWAELGEIAASVGRPSLAIHLVERELHSERNIQLLLKLCVTQRALIKAIGTGDALLVKYVLRTIQQPLLASAPPPPTVPHQTSQGTAIQTDMLKAFTEILTTTGISGVGFEMFCVLLKEQRRFKELADAFHLASSPSELGLKNAPAVTTSSTTSTTTAAASSSRLMAARMELLLGLAVAPFLKRLNDPSTNYHRDRRREFFNRASEESREKSLDLQKAAASISFLSREAGDLINAQRELQLKSHAHEWEGGLLDTSNMSLKDTIIALLARNQQSEAEHLKNTYRVTPRRFLFYTLESLVRQKRVPAIVAMLEQKNCPLPTKRIVEALISIDALEEAEKGIGKVKNGEEEAQLWEMMGKPEMAQAARRRRRAPVAIEQAQAAATQLALDGQSFVANFGSSLFRRFNQQQQ